MAEGALAAFLTSVGSVFTALIGWMSSIGSAVTSTPVLFVPCVIGIGFVAVGLFCRLKG